MATDVPTKTPRCEARTAGGGARGRRLRTAPARLAVALAATALAAACGGGGAEESGGAGTPAESSPEAGVTVREGGRIEFRGEGGETFTMDLERPVELPADYPEDVPRLPGATPVMANSAPGEGSLVVMFEAETPAEEVFSFYRQGFEEAGWKIAREVQVAGQHILLARKEDREANLIVGGHGEKSQIALKVNRRSAAP